MTGPGPLEGAMNSEVSAVQPTSPVGAKFGGLDAACADAAPVKRSAAIAPIEIFSIRSSLPAAAAAIADAGCDGRRLARRLAERLFGRLRIRAVVLHRKHD